jgi:ribosomal protein L25 (general stress protein Ctc)
VRFEGKVEITFKHHAMKAYRRRRGKIPGILYLGNRL